MTSERRPKIILQVLQVFFYLAFVFLWFKDNFPAFKKISLSPLWGFVPLAAVLTLRLVFWLRARKISRPANWKKNATALGLLIILATFIHLPFLLHSFGLMDSDEAITALMSKHIAEGKQPPLYFYGAFFQGSFPQHYTALFFRLFGYSIFLAKLSAYLAFAAFLGIQFFLLKKAFSFGFACAAGLFYVFPWEHLVRASFDLASGFPVVLLLGSLIFFLTLGVVFDDKPRWTAALGFLLGLAFWTHQISIIFCVSVAPFLIYKFRARLKNYLAPAVYFLVGCFPLVLNEFARGFPIVRVFFLGQSGSVGAGKLSRARRLLLALFSSGPSPASLVYLCVIAAGVLTVIFFVTKRKAMSASLIFVAYFISFMGIYLLSQSSGTDVIRYLYILYIAVPVLLVAPFLWIRSRLKYFAAAAFLILVFLLSQANTSSGYFAEVKANQAAFSKGLAAMAETGEKYWISDFWTSYLLTSLSKEKIIVASYSVRRYYPYELWYWSEGRNNWVFSRAFHDQELYANVLPDVLDRLGVRYKKKEADGFTLVYRIEQAVFPRVIFADPSTVLPEIRLERIATSGGMLILDFFKVDTAQASGLGFRIEIPGYSVRFFPMPEEERFSSQIPFPEKDRIRVKYGLTHAGFRIERSAHEIEYTIAPSEIAVPRKPVEYLFGIGPQKQVEGRLMSVCQKEAQIEVNAPLNKGGRLAIDLYSPFDFEDPFWYGDYRQEVSIFINGRLLEAKTLDDGKNRLLIKLEPPFFEGRHDIVRLEFKYAMPVSYYDNRKTAAYLEHIALE
jgi:hypothetical protein